jgi:tetratricopeptide (TPR) repeat protein
MTTQIQRTRSHGPWARWRTFLRVTLPVLAIVVLVPVATARAQGPLPQPSRQQTDAEGPAAKCLQEAHSKLMKEGPDKSLDAFRECARQFPDSPDAHFSLGMGLYGTRQAKEAVEEFKRVLALQPENVPARAMLGKLYSFDDTKLTLAEEVLKQVIEAHPYYEDAIFDLGRVYARRGEPKKAIPLFARALASEQRFALYHFELGKITESAGELQEARQHFQRALLLNPKFTAAGEELKRLGQKTGESPAPPSSSEQESKAGSDKKK